MNLRSLAGIALQRWDSDACWTAIQALQMAGSPDTVRLASRLAKSRNRRKRALGLYIASQLHEYQGGVQTGSRPYALETTQELLLAGLDDSCSEVIAAAVSGLGHRPHPLAVPGLVKFSAHPAESIRFSVAVALGSYASPEAIDALLRLAKDVSGDVRNWATFGLGSMHDVDNARVRDLLWSNLTDSHDDVRGEALVGLAVRKDTRIIPVLLERLGAGSRVFELTAAEYMASPLLLARLNAIKDEASSADELNPYWYRCLLDAIDACSSTS